MATLEVVHAYHGQALAAPLYFPSTEALPGQATGGQRPPEDQPAETATERAQFQAAVRRAVLGRVPARPERVRAGLFAVRRRRRGGRPGLAAPSSSAC